MELNLQSKRVRFYIRATSSINQHKQLSNMELFALKHMIPFDDIYFDKCDSNFPRTELNKALQEANQYDILVVLNSAVLHVDSTFSEIYENVFNDKGVQIINLTQEQLKMEASNI